MFCRSCYEETLTSARSVFFASKTLIYDIHHDYQKVEHALSEEMILNEVSMGGSPSISAALHGRCLYSTGAVQGNIDHTARSD